MRKFSKKYKHIFPLIMLFIFAISLVFGVGSTFSNSNLNTEGVSIRNVAENNSVLKFVQFSDIHLDSNGKDNSRRLFADSEILFKDAITQVNNIKDLDFVVFSGDVVNKPLEKDFLRFIDLANTIQKPWYISTGNHDIGINSAFIKSRFLDLLLKGNKNIQSENTYYSFSPKKGYQVIVLDGVIDNKVTSNGYFSKEQLDWLKSELDNHKDSKVIIVHHHPVIQPFESKSHYVLNTDEYLNVIDKYTNIVAVLSGHYHAAKLTKRNNVIHVSTPALVEYPNAFRLITISDKQDKIQIDLKLITTSYKELQSKSQARARSWQLSQGQKKDRDATFVIEKAVKVKN